MIKIGNQTILKKIILHELGLKKKKTLMQFFLSLQSTMILIFVQKHLIFLYCGSIKHLRHCTLWDSKLHYYMQPLP